MGISRARHTVFAGECVVNQRRVTVGHLGVDGKLGVPHILSLSNASLCLKNADIDVGVTLWVGVFLDWPFSEAVQSDAGLTTDPRLCLVLVFSHVRSLPVAKNERLQRCQQMEASVGVCCT